MPSKPQLGDVGKTIAALILTVVGGFVDAVGYIALYQIFTANMSGNSIHVGMYLAQVDFLNLARPACAILGYLLGVISTRIAMEVAARKGFAQIACVTFTIEALLLVWFAVATPAMHFGQIVDLHSATYFSFVAALAFAMGMQTGTLTHVGALTVYTTFVTGTLTKTAEALTRVLFWIWDQLQVTGASSANVFKGSFHQKDVHEAAILLATWSCYVGGAAFGTVAKGHWQLRSLFVPVAILLCFALLDLKRPISVQEERRQHGRPLPPVTNT